MTTLDEINNENLLEVFYLISCSITHTTAATLLKSCTSDIIEEFIKYCDKNKNEHIHTSKLCITLKT